MKYRVILQHKAELSLEEIFSYIAHDSPSVASRFTRELYQKCRSLSDHPQRCPFARENGLMNMEIRNLIHGNYRIVFTIKEKSIHILDIRHSARLPMDEK
jgi:plasmid stabilization system protein ParE